MWIVKNEVGLRTTGVCLLGFVFETSFETVDWILGGWEMALKEW